MKARLKRTQPHGCLIDSPMRTTIVLRQACRDDIAALHRVRMAVRENRLTSTVLTEDDYVRALEPPCRTWLVASDGDVIAFAAANAAIGNIWALFVDPDHERLGYGRQLHDVMVAWLWEQGVTRAWLTTTAGTRAHRFYVAAGWTLTGPASGGEIRFELSRSAGVRQSPTR
jgi:GNAT superfamily N-acetyltransferase